MVLNDPTNPFQRTNVVQRRDSRFDTRVKLEDCIHGRMSPGGDLATLVVLDFIFQSQKRKIRIKSARIELSFEEESGRRERDPEVFGIAPNGAYNFVSCPVFFFFPTWANYTSNPRDKLRHKSEVDDLDWIVA